LMRKNNNVTCRARAEIADHASFEVYLGRHGYTLSHRPAKSKRFTRSTSI
jgi:hypothetical protein